MKRGTETSRRIITSSSKPGRPTLLMQAVKDTAHKMPISWNTDTWQWAAIVTARGCSVRRLAETFCSNLLVIWILLWPFPHTLLWSIQQPPLGLTCSMSSKQNEVQTGLDFISRQKPMSDPRKPTLLPCFAHRMLS